MLQTEHGSSKNKRDERRTTFRLLLHELFKVRVRMSITAAGSKIVKPAGIVFQELSPNSIWDIVAILQILRSTFGPVRVRIIGRVNEQILPYFFYYATEKRFVSLTPEEDPARFQVIAGRAANQVPGVIAWILKVIVHPFHMSGNPTDASFQKCKLEILVAVQ
jgi:hypothetical protein